jgi:hypothetical protein
MSELWVKFKTNNAVKVSTEECLDVDDFLGQCKKELSSKLGSYDVGQLSLSTTDGGLSLRPDLLLNDIPSQPGYLKNDDEHPLFISIADGSTQGIVGSLRTGSRLKAPHRKRKERWEKLNEIFERNKKKSKTTSGNSYVSWSQVKDVLRTTPYVQSSKAIPEIQFNILSQYLSFAKKCFGPVSTWNDSQRLHLILPIIMCVCFLFNGDAQIEVEEDFDGNFLKAHGHFEFVLRRGDKRVCIVEAKKGNMREGMAQDLLGCEVAAEIGHLNLVYGIVTNYVQWNFLRSLDEKIELEEFSIDLLPGGEHSRDSLIAITGKIYAMLSDE